MYCILQKECVATQFKKKKNQRVQSECKLYTVISSIFVVHQYLWISFFAMQHSQISINIEIYATSFLMCKTMFMNLQTSILKTAYFFKLKKN